MKLFVTDAVGRTAAEIFEAVIRGKPDCVLGIGHNGHIGFNDPCGHFPAALLEEKR